MDPSTANPLLDEIESLQDQVLADLDVLNDQIKTVLKLHLATEAGTAGQTAATATAETDGEAIIRHDLPMLIRPPYLHPTLFLPARIAG